MNGRWHLYQWTSGTSRRKVPMLTSQLHSHTNTSLLHMKLLCNLISKKTWNPHGCSRHELRFAAEVKMGLWSRGASQQAPAMKYNFIHKASSTCNWDTGYDPRIPKGWTRLRLGNTSEDIWVWSCSIDISAHIQQKETNLAGKDWKWATHHLWNEYIWLKGFKGHVFFLLLFFLFEGRKERV